MAIIAPSILAADFKCLEKQLLEIESSDVDTIHIDVMDGAFVPNISLGFPVIQSIRRCTKMKFDVHLMTEKPDRFLEAAAEAGADSITVHQEADRHLHRTIQHIKELGCKAGVAINPATSVETLRYILGDIDQVLLMTVNPGFGGQTLIPNMGRKIKDCREFFKSQKYSPLLELDGGITTDNAAQCIRDGADILVAGSSVFQGNIRENIEKFHSVFQMEDEKC